MLIATLENLAKWIDELAGDIEILKKRKSGGGDTVTITPMLETGEKIAEYTIGDTSGSLYSPIIPNIGDTEEHMIGKSGAKDLYCKRVNIAAFPATAFIQTAYPHGITGIDSVIDYDVYTSSDTGQVMKLMYIGASSSGVDQTSWYNANVDRTNVYITVGRNRSAISGYAIIYYTKTEPAKTNRRSKK